MRFLAGDDAVAGMGMCCHGGCGTQGKRSALGGMQFLRRSGCDGQGGGHLGDADTTVLKLELAGPRGKPHTLIQGPGKSPELLQLDTNLQHAWDCAAPTGPAYDSPLKTTLWLLARGLLALSVFSSSSVDQKSFWLGNEYQKIASQ